MWQLKGICLLAALASVMCQELHETKVGVPLQFREIRQVMKEDDPSGKNHSIKVVIDSYLSLPNVKNWTLLLQKNGADTVTYTTKGDGSIATSQTEFVFDGNLVETNSVFLIARNETKVIATAYVVIALQDLQSNVAWVGDYETGQSASLRVTPGGLLKEVTVGKEVCATGNSPCYYITPKPKPTNIERCIDIDIDGAHPVKQCDDRVTSFKEHSSPPNIFLKNNTLEVEYIFKNEKFAVEVVAYDPLDSTKIFTGAPFRCLFPVGKYFEVNERIKCRQSLNLPEGQEYMMVLVVKLHHNDVIASSLLTYGDTPLPPTESNAGVIVGAVFGTMFGLAVIVLLVVCFMKKKDKKNLRTERGSSAVYATTTTTDPAEA